MLPDAQQRLPQLWWRDGHRHLQRVVVHQTAWEAVLKRRKGSELPSVAGLLKVQGFWARRGQVGG